MRFQSISKLLASEFLMENFYGENEMRQSSPEATEIFYLSQIDEALREKYNSTEYSRIPLFITGGELGMEHYIKESIEPKIPDFSPSEKGAVHIIQAESGSGKTILCQRLLFDWANKRGIWAKARFIFYVSSTQILEEEIKNSLKKEEMNKIKLNAFIYKHLGLAEADDLDEIIKKYDQEIIFILDGYDELLTHNLHDLDLIGKLVNKKNIFVFTRYYGIRRLDQLVKDKRDLENGKAIQSYELLALTAEDRIRYINVLFENTLSSSDKQSNSQLFFSWLFNGRNELIQGDTLFGNIVTKPLSLQFLAGAWKNTFQDRFLPNKYQLLINYVGYATNRFLIKRGLKPDARDSMLTLAKKLAI